MRYWIMRLFLAERPRPPLFDGLGIGGRLPSRQEYLAAVFGADIAFRHRKRNYVYKAFPADDAQYLAGVIGRERALAISLPPEQKFAPSSVTDWETANVFLNTSGGVDGQKIAMQDINTIGKPLSVIRSLVDHINSEHKDADWQITVNAITSQEGFWTAVERNKNHISEIDLNFAVPNIWGGTEETTTALRGRLETLWHGLEIGGRQRI